MKRILSFAIISSVLGSCNSSPESQTRLQEPLPIEAGAHDVAGAAIELNNGHRWIVNDEMKPFVSKGEELVSAYLQSGQTDYQQLARQIREQNSLLIKSCTMDGKSHEELHKWLHPHLAMVEELEQAEDDATAGKIISQLQKSYALYHQHFE